jgi:hypothetical protein
MSTQEQPGPSSGLLPPPGTKNPPCPTCERRMTVKQVMPLLFASGLDDVIYGCEKCGTEIRRTVKRT